MTATTRVFPVACPICGGCGTVPPDFYTRMGSGTSCNREACRTCNGVGTVTATETTTSDWWPGHAATCSVKGRDPRHFQRGNPDSAGHCESCHCTCDIHGPRCGHTAGCPGC